MAFQSSDPEEGFRRDLREHGGAPEHLDDDRLPAEAEQERVDAGVDAYDPNEVPSATDTPPLDTDVRDTEQYQEERAELRREGDKDEVLIEGESHQLPTRP